MEVERADQDVRCNVRVVLNTISPTRPLTLWDVQTIWELLRPLVAKPYLLDIYHTGDAIHVGVKRDGETIYERQLQPAE